MTRWNLLSDSLDDSKEENTNENFMDDNNPIHIDSKVNMNIKTKSNSNENMANNNLDKELSEINIEDLLK